MTLDLRTWRHGEPTCARCGAITGCVWMQDPLEGGHIAFCPPHSREVIDEVRRHEKALSFLCRRNYKPTQDSPRAVKPVPSPADVTGTTDAGSAQPPRR